MCIFFCSGSTEKSRTATESTQHTQISKEARKITVPIATKSTTAKPATPSVCDYLCSIQEGGTACDCSRPVIPGK